MRVVSPYLLPLSTENPNSTSEETQAFFGKVVVFRAGCGRTIPIAACSVSGARLLREILRIPALTSKSASSGNLNENAGNQRMNSMVVASMPHLAAIADKTNGVPRHNIIHSNASPPLCWRVPVAQDREPAENPT